ncbi:hypothetical protein GXW82_34580 [Streptacidiphilus sp. 4-A2]|nr:hypothetical protein [Streptacidiphilus sp. 4-A2]
MDDEPLEQWAQRRDARRRPVGQRKAVPLGDGRPRGAHLDPDVPRGAGVGRPPVDACCRCRQLRGGRRGC